MGPLLALAARMMCATVRKLNLGCRKWMGVDLTSTPTIALPLLPPLVGEAMVPPFRQKKRNSPQAWERDSCWRTSRPRPPDDSGRGREDESLIHARGEFREKAAGGKPAASRVKHES